LEYFSVRFGQWGENVTDKIFHDWFSIDALLGCKRRPFAMQNMPFYNTNCNSLRIQGLQREKKKGGGGKIKNKGKKMKRLYRRSGPRPKGAPPKPLRREGMYLAGCRE